MCFRSAGGVFVLKSNLQRILSSERGAEIFVSVDIVVNTALDCKIIKIRLRGLSGRRHSRSRICILNELAVFNYAENIRILFHAAELVCQARKCHIERACGHIYRKIIRCERTVFY